MSQLQLLSSLFGWTPLPLPVLSDGQFEAGSLTFPQKWETDRSVAGPDKDPKVDIAICNKEVTGLWQTK